MNEFGKWLTLLGVAITVAGAMLWTGLGRGWLGQLPGDFRVARGNFQFFLPVTTCLLVSAIITVLLWIFRR